MSVDKTHNLLTVFVSYNRMDNRYSNKYITSVAERIEDEVNERLGNAGSDWRVELWMDNKVIPGQIWRLEIAKALNRSAIMLSFVTMRYCKSGECKLEYDGITTGRYFVEADTGDLELSVDESSANLVERRPVVPVMWEREDIIRRFLGESDTVASGFLDELSRGQNIDVSSAFDNEWMEIETRTENIVKAIVPEFYRTVEGVIAGRQAAQDDASGADASREEAGDSQTEQLHAMARLYLEKGMSFRGVEKEVLDADFRGFVAKKSLNAFGITAKDKGILKRMSLEEAMRVASDELRVALQEVYGTER